MKDIIAYCGVPGSYAEEAALSYFGEGAQLITAGSFRGAFEAIKQQKADYAVLPLENSSTGAIAAVYDLLGQYGFYIVGECPIEVNHCLLVNPGTELADITEVFSHEQGLFQSRDFLAEHPNWKQTAVYNTAAAAKKVSEGKNLLYCLLYQNRQKKYERIRFKEGILSRPFLWKDLRARLIRGVETAYTGKPQRQWSC